MDNVEKYEEFIKEVTKLAAKHFEVPIDMIKGKYIKPGIDPVKEPAEPIIKKSCETWVVRDKGIDYLFCGVLKSTKKEVLNYLKLKENDKFINVLMPFSEIEITDEIAKLRPMVIDIEDGEKEKLYGVNGDYVITDITQNYKTTYRLATVNDLQDTE